MRPPQMQTSLPTGVPVENRGHKMLVILIPQVSSAPTTGTASGKTESRTFAGNLSKYPDCRFQKVEFEGAFGEDNRTESRTLISTEP